MSGQTEDMDEAQAERVRTKPCKRGHPLSASYHNGKRFICRDCHKLYYKERSKADGYTEYARANRKRQTERDRLKRQGQALTHEERERAGERLRNETTRDDDSGCLIWTGALDRDGYGLTYVGAPWAAHRLAWLLAHGPIADGLVIDHLCHNRTCIEPDHLRVVTREQNNRNVRPVGRLGEVWDALQPNPYSTTWVS